MSETGTDPRRFITPEEIAADLQISRAAAYRLTAEIPTIRLKRALRIERADYEAWLRSRKHPAVQG